ncbi:MAG: class I SAM-dependent methyltransferase [Chlorobiaceae bacterium]|nr:class I SAM-dependent methyltransferase [Chlorobiaceae bacterium]
MTSDELHALLAPEVLALIDEHVHDDPAEFAMQFHDRKELPVRAMAEQIACRQKAIKKLPSLSRFPLLYTRLGLEQASGERAAEWKAGLMSGRRIIDLTGGLGIDTIYFSRRFAEVISCERDGVLAELAEYNRNAIGVSNVEPRVGDSVAILETFPDDSFDWIFVDPARREQGGRSVGLEATSPDVVGLHDLMLRKAPKVCVKASPALEISGLQEKLPSLSSIVVVSVEGECKEILLLLDRTLPAGHRPSVRAVCLGEGVFEIGSQAEDLAGRVVSPVPGQWLYEPDAAIIKARLTVDLARNLKLGFLNHTVDYLTSDCLVDFFPGRSFRIEERLPFKPKGFRAELERRGITKAAIQRRDFPVSVEELRKKYRIGESSELFLFFTKDSTGVGICLLCRKP